MDNKQKIKQEDRSIVVAAVGMFTLKWFIQTIAAWAFSAYLTKLWKQWKAKKKTK